MEIQYYNTNDFLNQMEQLSAEFGSIEHYYKFIGDTRTFNNQVHYLNNVKIIAWNGFYSEKIIKITIQDEKRLKHCLHYKFKNNYQHYKRMLYFLRKKDF